MSDIPPSENTQEATPATQKLTMRARSIVNFITATTALIVAITGLVTVALKKFEEKEAKTGYEEVSKVISSMNEEITRNHDNLMELRNYLDGYFKSQAAFLSGLPAALRFSVSTITADSGNSSTAVSRPPITVKLSPAASLSPPRPNLPVPGKAGETSDLPPFDQIKALSADQ